MKIVMIKKGKKVQVGLDRTVIGLPCPSFPKTDGTPLPEEQIQLVHAKQKEFKAKMKYIESTVTSGPHHCKGKNKDLKRYYVQSETDGTHLCIFALGYSYGTTVINLELNPSKLNRKSSVLLLKLGKTGGDCRSEFRTGHANSVSVSILCKSRHRLSEALMPDTQTQHHLEAIQRTKAVLGGATNGP